MINAFSSLMPNVTKVLESMPSMPGISSGMKPPSDEEPVTPETMEKWNKLIKYAKDKGYSGLPELDHNPTLRQKIFDEYNKVNPNDQIPMSMVKPVQSEMQKYRQKVLDDFKVGKAVFPKGVTPDNFMKNLSQEDNIFGIKTSSWQFPSAYINDKRIGFAPKVDMQTELKK